MSTSFNKGESPIQPTTKAVESSGSKIMPEKFNGAADGGTIGGWGDAAAKPSLAMGPTGRDGVGVNAKQSNATPTTSPPTPAPNGRDMGNRANPLAPASMTMADEAKGPNQKMSGERAAMGHAKMARSGGVVGAPRGGDPQRHAQPSLPTPNPTFPEAAAPFKAPVPMPTSRGRMSGTIQSGKGVRTGSSNLSPLRNRRPGPQ
jgi:hypothetical protein